MKLLRHDIRLILKGLREIGRLRRHLLSLSIITAALEAIYPFINIYMTGLIIGAIALKQEWKTLVLLVCITVASNLLMLLLMIRLNLLLPWAPSCCLRHIVSPSRPLIRPLRRARRNGVPSQSRVWRHCPKWLRHLNSRQRVGIPIDRHWVLICWDHGTSEFP